MRGRTVVVMELKTVASSPTVLHLSHILVWHFFSLVRLVHCDLFLLSIEVRRAKLLHDGPLVDDYAGRPWLVLGPFDILTRTYTQLPSVR